MKKTNKKHIRAKRKQQKKSKRKMKVDKEAKGWYIPRFVCSQCKKSFPTKTARDYHIRNEHE